jgi:hypothetical protein
MKTSTMPTRPTFETDMRIYLEQFAEFQLHLLGSNSCGSPALTIEPTAGNNYYVYPHEGPFNRFKISSRFIIECFDFP